MKERLETVWSVELCYYLTKKALSAPHRGVVTLTPHLRSLRAEPLVAVGDESHQLVDLLWKAKKKEHENRVGDGKIKQGAFLPPAFWFYARGERSPVGMQPVPWQVGQVMLSCPVNST